MAPGGYETEEELEAKDNTVGGSGSTTLDELQSKEYRLVLDVVDRLRTCGLGAILPLPRLVVCGNQSSGKSSVLEAITEVPFPRQESLCTRFATEILMRRDTKESIRAKIIPGEYRNEADQAKLTAFNETITDLGELPNVIEKATKLMGLGNLNENDAQPARAFSRDVLSIALAGPERAPLSLVDLPCLILAANRMQSKADVKLIHEVVNDYLTQERTIILAVNSAKDDYANQGIIPKCKDVDPEGHRTLGVITKPDCLRPGSNNERSWLNLAQNKDVFLHLGWHMVKNRSEDDNDASVQARNASEAAFFSEGAYRTLQPRFKGISQLRRRLAQVLYNHYKKELPKLQAEVTLKHADVVRELAELGEKRSTIPEQRRFLVGISMAYQAIVTSAVSGHYELHPFFATIDTTKGFEDPTNMRRLYAAVHHHNCQFTSQMRRFGSKYRIPASAHVARTYPSLDLLEPPLDAQYAWAAEKQTQLSRNRAVLWAAKYLEKTHGRELPGTSNTLLVSELFWEQAENWKALALAHVELINELCCRFVLAAIKAVVTPEIADRLWKMKLDGALQARRQAALQELDSVIEDKNRALITYEPAYIAAVQESRRKRAIATRRALVNQAKLDVESDIISEVSDSNKESIDPCLLPNGLQDLLEPDMSNISAEEALDAQLAYYEGELTYFNAFVTKRVIDRHLLQDLAVQTLSPMTVNDMADDEVAHVAAEPEDVSRQRELLEDHKAVLENAQAELRQA